MLKLHVEVTVLDPDKKKKATAAWVVYEGKTVRGAGRISKDPKGLIATAAGRTFAAELHAAHGKLVKPTSIPVGAPAAEKPAKAAKGKQVDAPAPVPAEDKPAKKGKKAKAADGHAEGNGAAEPNGAAAEAAPAEAADAKPEKKAKAEKPKKPAKKSKKPAPEATAEA